MKRLLLFFLLLCDSRAHAADVLFDSAAEGDLGNGVQQVFSITVGANSDRNLFIFWGGSHGSSACSVTDADFNGDAASLVVAVGVSTAGRVELWKLAAPDTGTHDVTINTSCSGFANFARAAAVSVYNSHQTVSLGTELTQTVTSGTSVSLAPDSVSGDLVINGVYWEDDPSTVTLGAGQTERADLDGFRLRVSTELATGTSTTMSYTTAADETSYTSAVHIAVSIKQLTSATSIPVFQHHRQQQRNHQ